MSTELNVGLLCLALHGGHRGLARFRSGLLRLLQLTIHLAANVHAYPNDGQYKTHRHRSSACDAGDCTRTQTVVLSDRGQRRQRRRRWGWQRRRRRRWIWWKKWPSVVKLDGGPCVSPHCLEHHDVFPRRTRFRIDTVATGACPIPASLQQKLRDAASARALPELRVPRSWFIVNVYTFLSSLFENITTTPLITTTPPLRINSRPSGLRLPAAQAARGGGVGAGGPSSERLQST